MEMENGNELRKLIIGSCVNNNDYELTNSNCTLRECTDRSVNLTKEYPCGVGNCFLDAQLNKCTTSCSNGNDYEINTEKKSCKLKDFITRISNGISKYGCGNETDGCVLDRFDDFKCNENCNDATYYKKENGICVKIECDSVSITGNDGDEFGCGGEWLYYSSQCLE
jgi:hypothetical protein